MKSQFGGGTVVAPPLIQPAVSWSDWLGLSGTLHNYGTVYAYDSEPDFNHLTITLSYSIDFKVGLIVHGVSILRLDETARIMPLEPLLGGKIRVRLIAPGNCDNCPPS